MAHAAGSADRAFQHRGAAVDREFRFSVKDHEHLFALIVEVVAHAAAGHDLAAVKKIEIGGERVTGQQGFARHIARASVGTAARVFGRIGMSDALSQCVAGQHREGRCHQQEQ